MEPLTQGERNKPADDEDDGKTGRQAKRAVAANPKDDLTPSYRRGLLPAASDSKIRQAV